ncbi:MAG: hypothetical protein JRG69_09905 [Deltaproteobacteria bacterium]|nr:hypothetical protein [Deltaproteobacteria bacterium]
MSMNQHTAEVRKLTAAEFGKSFSDKQKEAEDSQTRQTGAKEAMTVASENLVEMLGQIREKWKTDGIVEGFSKEELEKMTAEVKKSIIQGQIIWVQRCVGSLDALVIQCDQAIILAGAKIKAFKEAEDQAKAMFEFESAKMDAFQKSIKDGTVVKNDDGEYVLAPGNDKETNSVVGVHPGLTEKQKRLAEEKAEKDKAEAKPPEEKKRLRPKRSSKKAAAKRKKK